MGMSVPTNIRTLLSGNVVEWARIEFKETWDAEPLFETDEERTYFATTLFFHPGFVRTMENEYQNDTENDTVICDLSKNEAVVFQVLQQRPDLSADQVAALAEVSRSTVNRTVKKLKEKGLIRRNGSDRKGTWIINPRA